MAESRRFPIPQIVLSAVLIFVAIVGFLLLTPDIKGIFSLPDGFKESSSLEKIVTVSEKIEPFVYIITLLIIGILLFLPHSDRTAARFAGICFLFEGLFFSAVYLYLIQLYSQWPDYKSFIAQYYVFLIQSVLYVLIAILLLAKPQKIVIAALFVILLIGAIYRIADSLPNPEYLKYLDIKIVVLDYFWRGIHIISFASVIALLLISFFTKHRIKAFRLIWFIPAGLNYLSIVLNNMYYYQQIKEYSDVQLRYLLNYFFGITNTILPVSLLLLGYWLLKDNEKKPLPQSAMYNSANVAYGGQFYDNETPNQITGSGTTKAEMLAAWQKLYVDGVITEAEYEAKRKQILGL